MDALRERGFEVERIEGAVKNDQNATLVPEKLKMFDLLILAHPCSQDFEKTTSDGNPALLSKEIVSVVDFVNNGGGLLLIAEYENGKYKNNLGAIAERFGITIPKDTTVRDLSHSDRELAARVPIDLEAADTHRELTQGVSAVTMYRCTSVETSANSIVGVRVGKTCHPSSACVLALATYGEGRVAVVGDSDLFGDEFLEAPGCGHRQLWINLAHWLAHTGISKYVEPEPVARDQATVTAANTSFGLIKETITLLRAYQNTTGALKHPDHKIAAEPLIEDVERHLESLRDFLPHQRAYFTAVREDLAQWSSEGCEKPDFSHSLAKLQPHINRKHGKTFVAVQPMYKQNGSKAVQFEALQFKSFWPTWLDDFNRKYIGNEHFLPAQLVDGTDGYSSGSQCVVLFPEMVPAKLNPTNNFGVIFCDREVKWFSTVVPRALEHLKFQSRPALSAFLASPDLQRGAFAVWDLLHDSMHLQGPVPFAPFLIRKKWPFWIYAIEELRVDLDSYIRAVELENKGEMVCEYVRYAIVLDRILRFPLWGKRIKNFDALAGQIFFSHLVRQKAILLNSNNMQVDWDVVPSAVESLRSQIHDLCAGGLLAGRTRYWRNCYRFVAKFVDPCEDSVWNDFANFRYSDSFLAASDAEEALTPAARALLRVRDDEFPLNIFYEELKRDLSL